MRRSRLRTLNAAVLVSCVPGAVGMWDCSDSRQCIESCGRWCVDDWPIDDDAHERIAAEATRYGLVGRGGEEKGEESKMADVRQKPSYGYVGTAPSSSSSSSASSSSSSSASSSSSSSSSPSSSSPSASSSSSTTISSSKGRPGRPDFPYAAAVASALTGESFDASSASLTVGTTTLYGSLSIARYLARKAGDKAALCGEGGGAVGMAEVDQWLDFAVVLEQELKSGGGAAADDAMANLEVHIAMQTFLVGYQVTLADVAVWAVLSAYDAVPEGGHIARWCRGCESIAAFSAALGGAGRSARASPTPLGPMEGGGIGGGAAPAAAASGGAGKKLKAYEEGTQYGEKDTYVEALGYGGRLRFSRPA